jgi:hypothetical protein
MEQVSAESEFVGDEEVEVVCRTPQNWYGESGIGGAGITFMSPGGRMGPDDLAQAWVKKAMFGDAAGQPRTRDALGGFAELDAPTLPQVLQATKASGWLAEGLVRLYAVEEVARYQAGYFTRLEVGPATARGVRIVGEFEASPQMAAGSYKVPVQGTVPLIG